MSPWKSDPTLFQQVLRRIRKGASFSEAAKEFGLTKGQVSGKMYQYLKARRCHT